MARIGILRGAKDQIPQFRLPSDLQPAYEAAMMQPTTYNAFAAETGSAEESAAQVAATGPLGDLPLAVVSAQNSFDAFRSPPNNIPYAQANRTWMELQTELAALSTNSIHLIGEEGAHYIHLDEPELVIEAIRQVLDEVRSR